MQHLTIGNTGENATGPVRITYTLSPYVNVDRSQPLQAGCAFLYENPDFTVSEILECMVTGPQQGQRIVLSIPSGWRRTRRARSSPARPSCFWPRPRRTWSSSSATNVAVGGVNARGGATPPPVGHLVAHHLAIAVLPNLLINRLGTEAITIVNDGTTTTQGTMRLTFTTPVFVNINRDEPPPGVAFSTRTSISPFRKSWNA